MLAPIISNNINQITALCKQHHVKELYVFGSAARNEMNEQSDVDFILKFNADIVVEDYADLYFNFADELENLLKRNVDLLLDKPIKNRFLSKELEQTKQMVYAAA
jgi:hypothetical protein